jgi:hypothetical protein
MHTSLSLEIIKLTTTMPTTLLTSAALFFQKFSRVHFYQEQTWLSTLPCTVSFSSFLPILGTLLEYIHPHVM